ncbi:MAG: CHASE3 domain-containing protein [Pirellulales bacterium]
MQNWTHRGALLGFAVVAGALLANSVVGYFNVRRLHRGRLDVEHSNVTVRSFNLLFISLLDAETGTRGFLVTGKEEYLEPYRTNAARFEEDSNRLAQLLSADPVQLERLRVLQEKGRSFFALLDEKILVRRQQGVEAIGNQALLQRGKQAMDEIRQIIQEGRQREFDRLTRRDREADANYSTAIIAGIVSTLLSLCLATAAYVLMRREAVTRAQTTFELQQAKERLEQRVVERTQALSLANDQLRDEVETRRQTELEILELSEELQRSNRELEQFASVASHDMQEPLRKIQAFGDRLNSHFKDQLGEKGQDYLARILAASGRMRRLIDDLLAYSRVATKGQAFVPVDLQQVALEVVDDLEQRIEETGGSVMVGELPGIDADPLQMRQLFQNLIANALKFHRPGVPPDVRVTSQQIDGECRLSVADNGIGFEPVYVDRIFNLFQRLHARETYEGTGIGLAICKKIVERHGGRITAESSPGAGATFTMTLPLSHADEETT